MRLSLRSARERWQDTVRLYPALVLYHLKEVEIMEEKTAVIYARYSSDRQREESIEGQIRVCEDFARRNGYKVLRTYTDSAMTGRTDQRPQFQLMIHDAASKAFSAVIVYKLNRFSRNRYDSAKYKHKLKKQGVKVVSAMENIADDPSGILLESVIEGMAEYYSAELAENVKRGMTENALEGKWPGGVVPLGYKLDAEHHLQVDAKTATAVQYIFRAYTAGATKKSIAEALNERAVLTSAGKKFTSSSFNKILKNDVYIGVFTWGNVKKEKAIPPIIDEDTFRMAQLLNERRKRHIIRNPEAYELSGKVFCGRDGARMDGKSGKSHQGFTYYYYVCSERLKKHCTSRPIRADWLDTTVAQTTTQLLSTPRAIDLIAKQAVKLQSHQKKSPVVEALEAEIAENKKKVENCIKAIEQGLMSESLTNHIHEAEGRIRDLTERLQREKILHSHRPVTEEEIRFFFYSIREQAQTKEAKEYRRILFTSLVQAVIVHEHSIEIRYNYKSELPVLQNPLEVESSHCVTMVDHQGFEPRTP